MSTLFIDMPSGIAGDMLLAALVHAGAPLERIAAELDGLGCGPIPLRSEACFTGSLGALRVIVGVDQQATWEIPKIDLRLGAPAPPPASNIRAGEGAGAPGHGVATPQTADHTHGRTWREIRDLLAAATLPERARDRAQRAFRVLAEAEAAVHGCPPEDIHFHEVGALDAIADVVGCALALEHLGIDRIVAGAITPGHGTVRCAHGLMPVPVPAVAEMLRSSKAPTRLLGRDTGELTTPTGCCMVVAWADAFLGAAATAPGIVRATGYGAGTKVIPGLVNAARVLVIDAVPSAPTHEELIELTCQIDDATGEELAHAIDALIAAGARDAWATPIVMKKGRPAQRLDALCDPPDEARLTALMLTVTPTLGVRAQACRRTALPRVTGTVVVDGQTIATKTATLPDGSTRTKPEADSIAAAAKVWGVAWRTAAERIRLGIARNGP